MRRTVLAAVFLLTASPAFAFNLFSAAKNEEGNRAYQKGQVAKARKTYESALKSDPKSAEIAFNLGNAYYKERTFGESLKRYEAAALTEKDPAFRSKAFYNLGNALHRTGQTGKAIEAYKQALRLNPKDQDAKFNLELLNRKKKEEDKKKPDPKKDEPKKDQPQDGQQKKDPQQGGGSGRQQPQDGQGNPDSSQGGQGQEQKPKPENGQGQEAKPENGEDQKAKPESGQGQEARPEPGQDKPSGGEKEPGNEEDRSDSQAGQAGEEKPQQPQDPQGQGGQTEEERQGQQGQTPAAAEPVKTDAERRAEQILAALQGQEQQVFRLQNDPERRRGRAQRLMEKDW